MDGMRRSAEKSRQVSYLGVRADERRTRIASGASFGPFGPLSDRATRISHSDIEARLLSALLVLHVPRRGA